MTPRRVTALLLIPLASAAAAEWRMTEDSVLAFEAHWEGTALPGRFEAFHVDLVTTDGAIDGGNLIVTVELVAADMDDPDINEAIAGEEWFAVDRFPLASFTSLSIQASGDGSFVAEGELEIKGHIEPITVPFTWEPDGPTATMTGALSLDRTRFGIGSGEWADDESIGKTVDVTFRVVFEQR